MTASQASTGLPGAGGGILDKERIVAKVGFNRWLVPPAALAIHLCIGMAYGFSVFWKPLQGMLSAAAGSKVAECAGGATTFGDKLAGTAKALFATDCEWTQFDVGWMYTLFFVFLGASAAIWGGWLERVGPRRAGFVSALCWCGGLLISALGVYLHQLWMMWLGSGVIGGIGLGLGYISPVSTLIKWFPDRRGMATGMAIMGFGGGAMIGSPLANLLMNGGEIIGFNFGSLQFAPGEASAAIPIHYALTVAGFKTAQTVGVWQTFVVLAAGYFIFMLGGAFGYRLPPAGWQPEGWTPPAKKTAMITTGNVHLKDAHKTPQFWLIWIVLCMNVSAGIGIIGAASGMLQETFGGKLIGNSALTFAQLAGDDKLKILKIGAGFVGLFSLFNIGGRFFWASLSDFVGRKLTYVIFFVLGAFCYGILSTLAGFTTAFAFAASFCIIASMYGGGFATIPAYLADMFGTQFVGAIHGRLLTAWSTAGIIGPFLVNYLHDTRINEKVPIDHVYDMIFYVLTGLLVIGFVANLLITPVAAKWFMSDEAVKALQAKARAADAIQTHGSFGIGLGALDAKAGLAWACVGIPLAWGVYMTLLNVAKILG